MRLLEIDTHGNLSFTQDLTDNIPPYAILSHTWGPDNSEVTFKDLRDGTSTNKAGFTKIDFCAKQARKDGLHYFWVDTCCIDKANYTELSEAINSMFRWYRDAKKCYVYLPDVWIHKRRNDQNEPEWQSAFHNSRWFTRGWTLQELLAPKSVDFYSGAGEWVGDRSTLEQLIHETTEIPIPALRGTPLTDFSIEERMRWASKRHTKKKEDKAYCLLGIFDIFLPLIYGEADNAITRLKETIDRTRGKQPSIGR
jgi:hypothetical protein